MTETLRKLEDLLNQNKTLEQRNEELRNIIDINLNQSYVEPAIDFQGLMDLAELKNLIMKFYQYNKIPIGLYDDKSQLIFSVGWKNICTKFHKTNPESAKKCCESIKYANKRLKDYRTFFYQCKNGLNAIAVPVEIQNKHIATIVISQFLYEGETIDHLGFEEQAKHFGFNLEAYHEAINEIPIFSRESINHIAENCSFLSELISFHATKNLEVKIKLKHQTDNDLILSSLKDKVSEQEQIIKSLFNNISDYQQQISKNTNNSIDLQKEIAVLSTKLEKAENILNSLLTSTSLGIGFIRRGIFTYVNDYMFKITGYTPKELIGRQPAILLPSKDDWQQFAQNTTNDLGTRKDDVTKLKIRRKDGTKLEIIAFLAPLDMSFPQKGQVISFMDISKIKKAETTKVATE